MKNKDVICGGVASDIDYFRNPERYMMCLILPDKQYKEYLKLLSTNKEKEAKKILKKYAWRP